MGEARVADCVQSLKTPLVARFYLQRVRRRIRSRTGAASAHLQSRQCAQFWLPHPALLLSSTPDCVSVLDAQTAPDMRRDSRMTKPPLRPKGGWTLVVQPLSRQKGKVSVARMENE